MNRARGEGLVSQVFVVAVNKNKFPQPRSARLRVPCALMKEGAPEEQFHNQKNAACFMWR